MKTPETHYSQIHTPNMLPDRSTDRSFHPDSNPADLSLTRQSFVDECDINNILKNNPLINPLTPEQYASLNFADLGDSITFHEAKTYLMEAQKAFDTLPAEIRARFENNPGKFLDFVQNPENQDELIRLKLATVSPVEDVPVELPRGATPSQNPRKKPPAPSEEAQA